MQKFEFLRQPLLGELAMSPERKKERKREKKMPFVVATYVYASSQGQRTHSARTNNNWSGLEMKQISWVTYHTFPVSHPTEGFSIFFFPTPLLIISYNLQELLVRSFLPGCNSKYPWCCGLGFKIVFIRPRSQGKRRDLNKRKRRRKGRTEKKI